MAWTWRWRASGEALHVSLAAGTLTLSFAGRVNLTFDGEGRLVGAWYSGRTYRRCLDNRVLAKWADDRAPAQRRRRFLDREEGRLIIERSYRDARRVLAGFEQGELEPAAGNGHAHPTVLKWLNAIAAWDFDALERHAAGFHAVYKPVSILPPDQYLSVVLQATEGCSYNECSFCTFYRDRRFRIKPIEEFSSHVDDVRSFLGRGLFLRRSIFLADANAIVIPQARLIPLLDVVNASFRFDGAHRSDEPAVLASADDWSPTGIHAFVSAPDALRKSVRDLQDLAARHVRRLYVGLETAHDPLRRFLRKPGTSADVLQAVQTIKQAGLQVGLIFMAGVGGTEFRDAHFHDTVELISRMPLSAGDIAYVSPFVPAPDAPYLDDMRQAGYSSLSEIAVQDEEQRFRAALLPDLKRRGVRVSRYDIREFVY